MNSTTDFRFGWGTRLRVSQCNRNAFVTNTPKTHSVII